MRKLLLIGGVLVLVCVAAAGIVGAMAWQRLHEPYKGYAGDEQFVEIPPGAGTAEIRRRLIDAGVVRDELSFRAAVWWSGNAQGLQAGEFRFDRPMHAVEVVEKIGRGDVYARRVTFREGLTIAEMAVVFEADGFGTARDFVAAAGDPALVRGLDPHATDLEGYLFPETYALPRGTPAPRLVAMMVDRFRATYTEDLQAKAREQGFTTRQVVTLASLVEKETGKPEERPLVAAVYRNRLTIGMGMQADPTVVYALQKAGKYDGNIRREDLQFDSPYNTYRYPGLPPGPIASPGKASLEAVLAPADVRYLYFVSRNDGSHVFAETLAQHNANVYRYQVLYFREQRLERERQRGTP
jgi:UPF0755 protein